MIRFPIRAMVSGVMMSASLGLSGCIFAEPTDPPLPGERIPVMLYDTGIRPDPELASVPVTVAPPVANAAWPQTGGNASHSLYHLELGPLPKRIFRVDAGEESSDEERLLAQPVVDEEGRLFVLDVEAKVTAFDGDSGRRLWRRDLRGDNDRDGTLGAGLAVDRGRVIVTTGFAQVIALDAGTGKTIWRRIVTAPLRAAPTVAEGRIFAVSIDNQTHALDATTGDLLWTHRGAPELASLLGGAAPAYQAGIVVVAYSSGELFGLRASNGTEMWSDYVARPRRTSAVSHIADIRASPVIDRGLVYAVSNSGRMVALNLTNGTRRWERQVAAVQNPWSAGDFLYVVTTDGLLLCMSRDDGRIRWVRSVTRYADERRQRGLVTWSGPILAGDRLILAGSNEEVLSISPYTGDLLGRIQMPDPVSIPPLVARNTLYFLTDDAELIAWR